MKRFISLCLCVCIFLAAIPYSAAAQSEQYTSESGLVYTVSQNDATIGEVKYTADIVGYTGDSSSVVIPKQITNDMGECTVTVIEDSAFEGSSITDIEINGLRVCISDSAFYGCKSLVSAALNDVDTVESSAFAMCTALSQVTFGEGLREIGDSAFSGCVSLESVSFPDSLVSLGPQSFEETGLVSVTIPANIGADGLNQLAFADCENLSSYEIAAGNKELTSDNCVIYSDSGKTVFMVPPAIKDIKLSAKATVIGELAFYGNLTDEIIVPANIEEIGDEAFYLSKCSELELHRNVSTIGDNAFDGLQDSVTVYAPSGSYVYTYVKANYPDYSLVGAAIVNASSVTVNLDESGLVCTDASQIFEPEVLSVYIGDNEINEKYYTVSYSNNVGKGTGVVTVTFQGRYSGLKTKTFVIKGMSLSPAKVVLSTTLFTYTGKVRRPAVSYVSLNGSKLPLSAYTSNLSSLNSVIPNSYTVKVTPVSGSIYDDSASAVYYIKPVMSGSVKVTVRSTSYLTVSWTGASSAQKVTGYEIYVGSTKFKTVASSVKSVKISSLKSGTAYTVKVRAYKKCSDGTIVRSAFKTLTTATKPAKVSFKSISLPKSKSLRVRWSKVSSCTGYQIQYSTSSKFKSGNKTVTVKSSKAVLKTITGLKSKKKYYVRIRAYKSVGGKNIYGTWSVVRSKVTK